MLNQVKNETPENENIKIGALLINEGFIRKADLDQAMEIQRQEACLTELPLGKLLVKKNLIDRGQLQSLLEHPEIVREIESFVLGNGRISRDRLACIIREKPAHQPLPEALVAAGDLSERELKHFFEAQIDSLKICELAMESGMISEADMARVLEVKRPPRAIGEILCELNLITPLDLNTVLAKYEKHLELGEILLKHELVDPATLDAALEIHRHQGTPLSTILMKKNALSERQLYGALAIQYNIPFETLDGFDYTTDQRGQLEKIVGKTFSNQFHILPLRLERNTLTVAVSDPRHLEIVNSLRSKRMDLRIQCVLATPAAMERLYGSLYRTKPPKPQKQPPPAAPGPRKQPPPPAPSDPPLERPESAGSNDKGATGRPSGIQAQQLVHLMLAKAIQTGARSIHLDLGLRHTTLRLRTGEGLVPPPEPWPEEAFQEMAGEVMDGIKEIAGVDPGGRHRPQEGMFRAGMPDSDGRITDMDFSVTTCPTLAGENMAIRRIGAFEPAPDLNKLPLAPQVVSSLKQAGTHPSGMILVAAPPGHSRAAALYGMLRHILAPDLKAVTVESSVSFSLPAAAQIQANPATDGAYSATLRTAIRLDPDILLAGELAGPESAAVGLEAAGRGIRLLAGIHAADAAGAIAMLSHMGMPPVQTAGLLRAVLAQRWVRKICSQCKQTYTPLKEEWRPLFEHFPEKLTFHRGEGCPACGFSGYRGRILLSELLVVNSTFGKAIKQGIGATDIRHLMVRSGVRTLIDDGLSNLHQTTLQEIIDAVPPEAAGAFRHIRADENDSPTESVFSSGEESIYGITLRSPEKQKTDIQRLHHAYEVLMEETGRTRPRSGIDTFAAFIKAQHEAISRRHGADRIFFSVRREEKKVVLTASPELMTAVSS